MARYGDDYGENDDGMQWLKAHDPSSRRSGWARAFGIIDHAAAKQVRRHEVSLQDLDLATRERAVHCNGCKESQRRRVHA